MSAIAKVLIETGATVTGSDLKWSRPMTLLEAMGAQLHEGHDAALVEGADAVVFSSAIPERNPELVAARAAGISLMSRGEALAALLVGTRSIVVAGTHGKTTTTSMIVSILKHAGLDPTYLVGGGLNEAGTNARLGSSDIIVAESDESDGSFLLLDPWVGVVTNVEMDHVDHWGSMESLTAAFVSFLGSVRTGGTAVISTQAHVLLPDAPRGVETVITGAEAGGDDAGISAEGIVADSGGMRFTLAMPSGAAPVALRVPGHHNVQNALSAAGAARCLGLEVGIIASGLSSFRGVERRYHLKGTAGGVTIIDDYAHHPTEVRATLNAARNTGPGRVVAVFQPHRFTRTLALWREFGHAFADADRVVITDVYGAGEEPLPGVTGKLIADAVCTALPGRPVAYMPRRDELLSFLSSSSRPGDTVLTMGAGDITSIGEELIEALEL